MSRSDNHPRNYFPDGNNKIRCGGYPDLSEANTLRTQDQHVRGVNHLRNCDYTAGGPKHEHVCTSNGRVVPHPSHSSQGNLQIEISSGKFSLGVGVGEDSDRKSSPWHCYVAVKVRTL